MRRFGAKNTANSMFWMRRAAAAGAWMSTWSVVAGNFGFEDEKTGLQFDGMRPDAIAMLFQQVAALGFCGYTTPTQLRIPWRDPVVFKRPGNSILIRSY
jgi:hypothetical protein